MPEGAKERLYAIMPEEFAQAMARAAEGQHMIMVLVVSEYLLTELRANRPGMIEMEDGAVIVLIPQDRVTQAYRG